MKEPRVSKLLSNQKIWEMARVITDRQRKAIESKNKAYDWSLLEELWFDWLEEELFGEDAKT